MAFKTLFSLLQVTVLLGSGSVLSAERPWIVYEPADGNAEARHVVLLAGDEEYRSEEALPMLARILSERHGFKCTVVFSVDPDVTINPDRQESLSHPQSLDLADAIVMALRFRSWPDEDMSHFVDAYRRGIPIIALRTSTHPFRFGETSNYRSFNNFGERVIGEGWISHWGRHKSEGTRGHIEPGAENHPVLRGVDSVFGDTDVYEAYPAEDATILMRGQVVAGINADDPPASYPKTRRSDGGEQDVNEPMMPVAWTRVFPNEAGNTNRIFATTLGAATDFQSEGLRRLVVNGIFWALEMEVPERANVNYVVPFQPTAYGFGEYKKGVRPSDLALPAGDPGAFVPLQLGRADRIAILGNALADRMQHAGYLETLIHAHHPNHELVFRNLSAAGDEVGTWFRSANFGSRDEWLGKVKADVIFAFYGFNESTRGEASLGGFKHDLDRFLKETKAANYSGRGSPQIVLFSPVANERHPKRTFPDPGENNRNIALYTRAMEEIAAANHVPFVNLFSMSQKILETAATSGDALTVNGLYLKDKAYQLLAPTIFEALFHHQAPAGDVEKLRAAVLEKNWQWHQRYRIIDGYNIYGGRSALSYKPNEGGFVEDHNPPPPYVSNFRVMQEELSQRDIMTANRDRRIWAIAQGTDFIIDDSNLPEVTPVETNEPGPNGKHIIIDGEEAIERMTVHPGMQVNLFADEKRFPELVNPVQMAWDTRGRLWVAVWPEYPGRKPTSTRGDALLVFEDVDGDGRAEKMTRFAENLNAPTGFQFYKDGVLLMQAPDFWYLRDTDGDGKADWRERVLMGMDSADSHHTANSLVYDPGGAIYLSDGVFHRTQVETVSGPVRNIDGAIYRFEPETGRFETYASHFFANPHGRVFDRWGNDIITDATGNANYFGAAFSGRLDLEKGKHARMQTFWDQPSRPAAGTGLLVSRHFPEEFQGNFLNLNVISFQGIYRVKVIESGSGLEGDTLDPILYSSDPNFIPSSVNIGPDGAIYLADWHNPIVGHMQHHLRDPSRDNQHGRIYRITYQDRPLLLPATIGGAPIPALLELLKEPEDHVRQLAKIELAKHDSGEVIEAARAWIATLDEDEADYEHHLMEALWVHQWHSVPNPELLLRMLASSKPQARAAAGRVLCYWRDEIENSLELFMALAEDDHPRVRLEAVRGASFYRNTRAVEVALALLKRPMDYYLNYALEETLRQLEPYWKQKLAAGEFRSNSPGAHFLLTRLSTEELMALPRTDVVLRATMLRPDASQISRLTALRTLAARGGRTQLTELLSAIADQTSTSAQPDPELLQLLLRIPRGELAQGRESLLKLARDGAGPEMRVAGWAALITADQSFDAAWREAIGQEALAEVVRAIPLLETPDLRNAAFDRIHDLTTKSRDLPTSLRRAAIRALSSMTVHPEKAFITLARLIADGQEPILAAQALRNIQRHAWSADEAREAAAHLVAWARSQPAAARSQKQYVEMLQVAGELAALLPMETAAGLQADLRELRVAVFVVRAVREQMRFDTRRLVVEAGKRFEIIFENPDSMPHNLVIVMPGGRQVVGPLADQMRPEERDLHGRSYVPDRVEVIAATRLLAPGSSERLSVTAPAEDGVYEFVCTFPGHWQLMWGELVVTHDVDAYLRREEDTTRVSSEAPADHGSHTSPPSPQ